MHVDALEEQRVHEQALAKVTLTVEKKTGYLVFGCTGCSCCESENFINGIYESCDDAEESAKQSHCRKSVASQYAASGIYTVREVKYEELSDGRIILGNRVFDDVNIYESGAVANELRHEGQELAVVGEYDKH